jgi:hypothetical protein
MTHRTRLSLLTLADLRHNGEGREYGRRPVLGYGKTWKQSGFTCASRSSGLTCRRGSHGFFLSRESRRFF